MGMKTDSNGSTPEIVKLRKTVSKLALAIRTGQLAEAYALAEDADDLLYEVKSAINADIAIQGRG